MRLTLAVNRNALLQHEEESLPLGSMFDKWVGFDTCRVSPPPLSLRSGAWPSEDLPVFFQRGFDETLLDYLARALGKDAIRWHESLNQHWESALPPGVLISRSPAETLAAMGQRIISHVFSSGQLPGYWVPVRNEQNEWQFWCCRERDSDEELPVEIISLEPVHGGYLTGDASLKLPASEVVVSDSELKALIRPSEDPVISLGESSLRLPLPGAVLSGQWSVTELILDLSCDQETFRLTSATIKIVSCGCCQFLQPHRVRRITNARFVEWEEQSDSGLVKIEIEGNCLVASQTTGNGDVEAREQVLTGRLLRPVGVRSGDNNTSMGLYVVPMAKVTSWSTELVEFQVPVVGQSIQAYDDAAEQSGAEYVIAPKSVLICSISPSEPAVSISLNVEDGAWALSAKNLTINNDLFTVSPDQFSVELETKMKKSLKVSETVEATNVNATG